MIPFTTENKRHFTFPPSREISSSLVSSACVSSWMGRTVLSAQTWRARPRRCVRGSRSRRVSAVPGPQTPPEQQKNNTISHHTALANFYRTQAKKI